MSKSKEKVKIITKEEAIKSLLRRSIIHCFAGAFGADWSKKQVIRELKMARKIAWVPDIFNHNLAVEAWGKSDWKDKSILRFDVQRSK